MRLPEFSIFVDVSEKKVINFLCFLMSLNTEVFIYAAKYLIYISACVHITILDFQLPSCEKYGKSKAGWYFEKSNVCISRDFHWKIGESYLLQGWWKCLHQNQQKWEWICKDKGYRKALWLKQKIFHGFCYRAADLLIINNTERTKWAKKKYNSICWTQKLRKITN